MKKRLLSTLLALCMALALLPAQAMAAEMDSNGTEPLPPVVNNVETEASEETESLEESQQGDESPDELYTEQKVPAEPVCPGLRRGNRGRSGPRRGGL